VKTLNNRLLDELNNSFEDNLNRERMTVEKMTGKPSDEISPVEKGQAKKFSDLCDFEGMDQYSNVIELLVEYTLFLEDTKMKKDEPDPDDSDGLTAQEQKRRRLLGRTIRLWKQKFQSLEYTVRAVHEFATQHKLLIGVLDGMRDFDFITIYGETRSNRRIFLAQLAKDLFIPIYPRIQNDPEFDSLIKRILYVRTKAIKKYISPNRNELNLNISTEKENSDLEEIRKTTKVNLSTKKRKPLADITTKKPDQPSVVKSKNKRPTKSVGGASTNSANSEEGIFTLTRTPTDPLILITEKTKISGSRKRKKDEKRTSNLKHSKQNQHAIKAEKLDIKKEFKVPKEPVSLPAKRTSDQIGGIITGFPSVKTEADLSNSTLPLLPIPRDESTPKRPKINPRPRFCIDDSGDSD